MVKSSNHDEAKERTVEKAHSKTQPLNGSIAGDLMLPFMVLVSPLKTFRQLAQRPTAKGLITLTVLVLTAVAASEYAFSTRIFIKMDDQFIVIPATESFLSWFVPTFMSTLIGILLYWSVFAVSFLLLGRILRGEETSLRNSLVIFAYALSVFALLYAIRAAAYLALPSLNLEISYWPPTEADYSYVSDFVNQNWSTAYAFQIGYGYFSFAALAWLTILGAIAQKTTRGISWGRALVVSITGFLVLFFLFGPP